MKKLLFLMSLLTMILFTSCKKDDEDVVIQSVLDLNGKEKKVEKVYEQKDGSKILYLGPYERPILKFANGNVYIPKSINQINDYLYKIDGKDYKFYDVNIIESSATREEKDKTYGLISYQRKYDIDEVISFICEVKLDYMHKIPKEIKYKDAKYEFRYFSIKKLGYRNYRELNIHQIYNSDNKEHFYCIPKFISSSLEPSN